MDSEKDRALYAYNKRRYGEVIRSARLKKGLSQRELADRLNVAKNYVSNWEAGRARPDLNLVPALCGALGLRVGAFFGERGGADVFSAEEKRHIRRYRMLSEANRAAVEGLMDTMLRLAERELREKAAEYRPLRLHELKASAGLGNPLDDGFGGTTVCARRSASEGADCLIRVTGDSMEPTLHDGDTLLVRYAEAVQVGEIGIFVADGDGFVKEYRADGLHSHNPKYPVLRFTDDDAVHCVGRVLGVLDRADIAPEEVAALMAAEGETNEDICAGMGDV